MHRIELALQSPLGVVLIFLVFTFLLLTAIYFFMQYMLKKRDYYRFYYQSYFDRLEKKITIGSVVGRHQNDFFGKKIKLKLNDGKHATCLIPPPEIATKEACERLRIYHAVIAHLSLPLFAPIIWQYHHDGMLVVQAGNVDENGTELKALKSHLKDHRFTDTDKEKILLDIARALASIHNTQTPEGDRLYYGLLLPQSILLNRGAGQAVDNVVLLDQGLAFSFGAEAVCNHFESMKHNQFPLETYIAHNLMEQVSFLAPEQRSRHRLAEVGPASDFYAFAMLAVYMFTEKRIKSHEEIEWKLVPERWHPFLQSCLHDDSKKRPSDFFELEDWLEDPELGLTYLSGASQYFTAQPAVRERVAIEDIASIPIENDEWQIKTVQERGSDDPFYRHISDATRAIKANRWQQARSILAETLQINPDHAEVQVKMAIVCYELGDFKEAEYYYDHVKKRDPHAAKAFRKHIAFRI